MTCRLTNRDKEILVAAWECFDPCELPRPDLTKLARLTGLANRASANSAYHSLMKKVRAAIYAAESTAETAVSSSDSQALPPSWTSAAGAGAGAADLSKRKRVAKTTEAATVPQGKLKSRTEEQEFTHARHRRPTEPSIGDIIKTHDLAEASLRTDTDSTSRSKAALVRDDSAGLPEGFYAHIDADDDEETLMPSAAGPLAGRYVQSYFRNIRSRKDSLVGDHEESGKDEEKRDIKRGRRDKVGDECS